MQMIAVPLSKIMIGDRILPPDEANIAALTDSIKALGFTSAIAVKARDDGWVDLISGFHRVHAAARAGLTEVPALVFDADTEPHKAEQQELLENLARRVLSASEKVEHIQRLMKSLDAHGDADDVLGQLCRRLSMSAGTLEQYQAVAAALTPDDLARLRSTAGDTVKCLTNLADMTPEARARRIARLQEEEARVAEVQISHLAARRTADMLAEKLRPSEISELLDQLGRTTLRQVTLQLESVADLRGGNHD